MSKAHQMSPHPIPTGPMSSFLDASMPNLARVFDYLTGGSSHFEVDRLAAERMITLIPSLPMWVRLRHAFIRESVLVLYEEGFRQFLDMGSGIPSEDHIHAPAAEARFVYSDINPVAVSYGNSLFAHLENVEYIFGNASDPTGIFVDPAVQRQFDLNRPVAIGLNALLLFLSPQDSQAMAQALYEWAPPGSKLFVVFQTRKSVEMPERYDRFVELTASAGFPLRLGSLEDNLSMLRPWNCSMLQQITEFLGLPQDFISEEDREGVGMEFYAAFLMHA